MIKLRNFTLKTNVIQSPMAGCTDLAFRLLSRQYGMEFAFLEMISADALVRDNRKTNRKMQTNDEDKPLGAQIVGCDPEIMKDAASKIEEMGYDTLDLNLGCPVPKIVSPGSGSALLREPDKCKKIFKAVVDGVKNIPVTVKMRKGYSDDSGDEAVEIARIAEDAGMSAVAVHGRTRAQAYRGEADWESIGKVKKAVNIPVFGNGDVQSGEDAKKLISISGCDGVMLGRGALGNPWLYKKVEAAINNEPEPPEPSFQDLKDAAIKHFELEIEWDGPKTGFLKCRRILCWYFRNVPGVVDFRKKINTSKSPEEMREHLYQFKPVEFGAPTLPPSVLS